MSIHSAIPLISFFAYFPILTIITLRRPQVRVHKVFSIYLIAAMVWSFCSFVAHAGLYPEHTRICTKFIIVTFVWMTVTYYHFVRAFLNKPSGFPVTLGYAFLAVVAVLVATEDFPVSAWSESGILHIDYGPYFYLLPIFLLPLAGAAALSLIQRLRSLPDGLDRNRVIYLFIGLTVVAVGAITNLSSLGRYPVDHIANLTNAVIITYAVLKYQLLDIRIVVRRGLAYSVLTVGLTTAYLFVLFVIQRSVFHWQSGYSSVAAAAGLALLFAVVFQPLRDLIQKGVDRLFYRKTYDYRQTLLNFSQRMSNVLNLRELAENMLYPLTMALGAKRAYLFLPEADGGDFMSRFVQPQAKKTDSVFRLGRDNPIVAWLDKENRILHRETIGISPEFKSLWETESDEIDALEMSLFCPIKRKGSLIGILGLSRKQSLAPYSNEDVDLLTTMATEAAIVIENATMLDNLKEQQRRVEQLLAQTVLAQEEERKRISVELHDSVAQWLVGASYRMQTCGALLTKNDTDEAQTELAEIESTIDRSLKEIRRVMSGLHPPALDELGLVHALRQLLEGLKPDKIAYHFECSGEPLRMSPSTELAMYRVVQESLNNIRKHSAASAVVLRLRFDQDTISVEVHDNGKGFNLSKTMRGAVAVGHMGVLGMKERATMLGGSLKIRTRQGSGTSLYLTLPVTLRVSEDRIGAGEHSTQSV